MVTGHEFDKEIEVMKEAALSAGRYLLQTKPEQVESVRDFVTQADFGADEIIERVLTADLPDIRFSSEESDGSISKTGKQFSVDAFDGTVNGYHGLDHWGSSIGLVRDGRSVAGVVYLPAKHQMFFAQIGGKAYMSPVGDSGIGEPTIISVNNDGLEQRPSVLVEWIKKLHENDHDRVVDTLARINKRFLYPLILNASTASLMLLATGKVSGFVHLRPEPCDVAASGLIVECAGGKVTDCTGGLWSPLTANRGIVASNGVIHDRLLDAIAA